MRPISLTRRAFLFDLDGVLVNSEEVVSRTWMRWAERTGIHIPDLLPRVQGRRSIDSIRDLTPQLDPIAESRWLADAEASDADGLHIMPGAMSLFTSLDDTKRAIVTSCDKRLATFRLSNVGIPLPQHMITADIVTEGKPSPEGYLLGARTLGVAPSECVVVEDAPAGIRAGRAAGATVIAVTTTFPLEKLDEAHFIVASLEHVSARAAESGVLTIDIRHVLGGRGAT